jgi:hypothetical protein
MISEEAGEVRVTMRRMKTYWISVKSVEVILNSTAFYMSSCEYSNYIHSTLLSRHSHMRSNSANPALMMLMNEQYIRMWL